MMRDIIGDREVIVTKDYISYGGKKMFLNEIFDYDYTHSYFNFSGGIDFTLYGRNNIIRISASSSIFQRRRAAENLKKVENLANMLLPDLNRAFVSHKVKQIENGQKVKIWKLHFDINGVSMRTRASLGLKHIKIPYQSAAISFERYSVGVFGGHGEANLFFLWDNRTGKKYKYSRGTFSQPTQGQYIKIKALFYFLKNRGSTKSAFEFNYQTLQ